MKKPRGCAICVASSGVSFIMIAVVQSVLRSGLRWTAAVFVISCFMLSQAAAQGGLPRDAISIPTDRPLAAGLQSAEGCGVPNKLIVLPPIHFQFAAEVNDGSPLEEQVRAIKSLPQGSDLWAHVIARGDTLTGNETEKQLTDRVDAMLKSVPLALPSVH